LRNIQRAQKRQKDAVNNCTLWPNECRVRVLDVFFHWAGIMNTTLLVLFLLILGVARGAPLVCTTETDAVALIAHSCQLLLNCRAELGTGEDALATEAWVVLLTEQACLLSANATAATDCDSRLLFMDAVYVTQPLVAYDNTSLDAVDCNAILECNIASPEGALIPVQVFDLLNALSVYTWYASDTSSCPEDNHVAHWTNVTGTPEIVCQCAPGKVCEASNVAVSSFLVFTGIFACVLALAMTLFVVVTTSMALWQAARLMSATRHYAAVRKEN
jgi:hypothetical protein